MQGRKIMMPVDRRPCHATRMRPGQAYGITAHSIYPVIQHDVAHFSRGTPSKDLRNRSLRLQSKNAPDRATLAYLPTRCVIVGLCSSRLLQAACIRFPAGEGRVRMLCMPRKDKGLVRNSRCCSSFNTVR